MDFNSLKRYFDYNFIKAAEKWRRRNSYYYADILRFLKYAIFQPSKVLQVGADDGWILSRLQPAEGVFLGLSQAGILEGRRKFHNLRFIEDEQINSLPLTERFDYVLLINTIGSVDDLLPYFARLHQIVKPSSRVIITYYNYLWEPIIKLGEILGLKQRQPIQNWLSIGDVANLLELSGFEVVKEGRRMLLPKYLPLLSEIFNEFLAKLPFFNRFCFWQYTIARPKDLQTIHKEYSVSVVVPARNERGNIEEIVRRVPEMGHGTELVFVEGGSTDGTWEEILRVKERYPQKKIIATRQDGRGKGDAVRKGFSLARGDILMILDADLTVAPEDLPRFYRIIASNKAEYVHGSRLVYPMEKGAMRFLNLLGNKFFSMVFSWLLKERIKDTLCGTKVLFRKDYEKIAANRRYFGDFDPFGDFDLIFGASKLSLKLAELPVHYHERKYGRTNISRFRHGWLLLKMCLFAFRKLE